MDLCSLIKSMARNCSKSTLIPLCLREIREDGSYPSRFPSKGHTDLDGSCPHFIARKARIVSMGLFELQTASLSGRTFWKLMLRRSSIGASQLRSTMILGSAGGRGSDMKRQRGQGVENLLRHFDFGALE